MGERFKKQLAPLGMRFFFVPGNHDLSNDMMTTEWEKRFGCSYYYFVYRNVLFLCLNTEDPSSHNISSAQVEYMAKAALRTTHQLDGQWCSCINPCGFLEVRMETN